MTKVDTGPQHAAHFKGAAKRLETHGWCQRALQNASGQLCMAGALNAEVTGDPDNWVPETFFEEVVRAVPGMTPARNELPFASAVVNWNNDPDRTAAEVIAALRRTAELAEEAA